MIAAVCAISYWKANTGSPSFGSQQAPYLFRLVEHDIARRTGNLSLADIARLLARFVIIVVVVVFRLEVLEADALVADANTFPSRVCT
jgi:hypothetical protein